MLLLKKINSETRLIVKEPKKHKLLHFMFKTVLSSFLILGIIILALLKMGVSKYSIALMNATTIEQTLAVLSLILPTIIYLKEGSF